MWNLDAAIKLRKERREPDRVLASVFGVSASTVNRRLRKLGLSLSEGQPSKIEPEILKEAEELMKLRDGRTAKQLARDAAPPRTSKAKLKQIKRWIEVHRNKQATLFPDSKFDSIGKREIPGL